MQIQSLKPYIGWLVTTAVLVVVVAAGMVFQDHWVPRAKSWLLAKAFSPEENPEHDAHGFRE
jgi:hypothetical protein